MAAPARPLFATQLRASRIAFRKPASSSAATSSGRLYVAHGPVISQCYGASKAQRVQDPGFEQAPRLTRRHPTRAVPQTRRPLCRPQRRVDSTGVLVVLGLPPAAHTLSSPLAKVHNGSDVLSYVLNPTEVRTPSCFPFLIAEG